MHNALCRILYRDLNSLQNQLIPDRVEYIHPLSNPQSYGQGFHLEQFEFLSRYQYCSFQRLIISICSAHLTHIINMLNNNITVR